MPTSRAGSAASVHTAFAHRNLPRLLLQAREGVMAHFRPDLRAYGLTDQQWRVLRVLGELGPSDTGTIATQAYLLGPSLSGVLARMEQAGLVRRARHAQDARRTMVQATAKGRKLVQRLSLSIETHYLALQAALGKTRLQQLYALLDELIAMEHHPA